MNEIISLDVKPGILVKYVDHSIRSSGLMAWTLQDIELFITRNKIRRSQTITMYDTLVLLELRSIPFPNLYNFDSKPMEWTKFLRKTSVVYVPAMDELTFTHKFDIVL